MTQETTQRLSVPQVCEALGDDNRFFASRALGKSFRDLTVEELLTYYMAHANIGMTVHWFDVSPAVGDDDESDQLPLFI